ncbi:MAG TPA: hypothetical protein VGL53_19185 [Bryobacteraceae bacterium]|jgi:hypothetical protein
MFDDSAAGVEVERRTHQRGANIKEDEPSDQESGQGGAGPRGGPEDAAGSLVTLACIFGGGDLREAFGT